MNDILYQKFVKRWEEVTDIPPQKFGILTPYYKYIVGWVKSAPWLFLVCAAALTVVGLYYVLGPSVTYLVTLLQRGF